MHNDGGPIVELLDQDECEVDDKITEYNGFKDNEDVTILRQGARGHLAPSKHSHSSSTVISDHVSRRAASTLTSAIMQERRIVYDDPDAGPEEKGAIRLQVLFNKLRKLQNELSQELEASRNNPLRRMEHIKIKELEECNRELKLETQKAHETVQRRNEKIELLEGVQKALERRLTRRYKELTELKEVKEELLRSKDEKREMEQQIQEAQERIEELSTGTQNETRLVRESLVMAQKALQDQKHCEHEAMKKFHEELDQMHALLKRSREECDRIKASKEETEKNSLNLHLMYMANLDQMQQHIEEKKRLKGQLLQSNKNRVNLRKEMEDLNAKLQGSFERNAGLQESRSVSDLAQTSLKKQVQMLTAQLEEAQESVAKVSNMQENIEMLKKEVTESYEKVNEVTDEFERVHQKLSAYQENRDSYNIVLKTSQSLATKLGTEAESLRGEIIHAEDRVQQMQQYVKQTQARLEESEEKQKIMEAHAEKERNFLHALVQRLHDQLKIRDKEISRLKAAACSGTTNMRLERNIFSREHNFGKGSQALDSSIMENQSKRQIDSISSDTSATDSSMLMAKSQSNSSCATVHCRDGIKSFSYPDSANSTTASSVPEMCGNCKRPFQHDEERSTAGQFVDVGKAKLAANQGMLDFKSSQADSERMFRGAEEYQESMTMELQRVKNEAERKQQSLMNSILRLQEEQKSLLRDIENLNKEKEDLATQLRNGCSDDKAPAISRARHTLPIMDLPPSTSSHRDTKRGKGASRHKTAANLKPPSSPPPPPPSSDDVCVGEDVFHTHSLTKSLWSDLPPLSDDESIDEMPSPFRPSSAPRSPSTRRATHGGNMRMSVGRYENEALQPSSQHGILSSNNDSEPLSAGKTTRSFSTMAAIDSPQIPKPRRRTVNGTRFKQSLPMPSSPKDLSRSSHNLSQLSSAAKSNRSFSAMMMDPPKAPQSSKHRRTTAVYQQSRNRTIFTDML